MCSYDMKSGLITPDLEAGIDVQTVTTATALGKSCTAVSGSGVLSADGRADFGHSQGKNPRGGSDPGNWDLAGGGRGCRGERCARAEGQSLHHPERQPANVPIRYARPL